VDLVNRYTARSGFFLFGFLRILFSRRWWGIVRMGYFDCLFLFFPSANF